MRGLNERAALLEQVPLFSGLAPTERAELAASCRERSYAPGDAVCREGDPGDHLFVVSTGELEVWGGSAPQRVVSRLGPGDVVGEISLLLGGARSATVTAARHARLLAIDRAAFARFVMHEPKALEYLSRVLCQRLVATSRAEVRAKPVLTVAVIGPAGEKGRTFIAASLAGLLADLTRREALLLTVVGGRRAVQDDTVALAEIADASVERIQSQVATRAPGPPTLAVRVTAAAGARNPLALDRLIAKLAATYVCVVMDAAGEAVPALPLIETVADVVVELSDDTMSAAAGGTAAAPAAFEDGAGAVRPQALAASGQRRFAVVNRYGGRAALALNHCLPFVLPRCPRVAAMSALEGARHVRSDRSAPIARPLWRLARKILGCSVGVALGGGAAFGLAHVGVFKVLEDNDVPVDVVAGTSIGSIVAIAYAAGVRPVEMIQMARRFGTLGSALSAALDVTFTRPGFLAGERLIRAVAPLFGSARGFDDLVIPCRTVATDIECGERVIIGSGRLDAAFRASCSVPMVWSPVREGERALVDGAVVDPVPAEVVRDMGADLCVAVNVVPPLRRGVTTMLSRFYRRVARLNPLSLFGTTPALPNMFDVVMNSLQILQYELGNFKAISADVRINPDLSDLTWIEFHRADEFIARGMEAAEKAVPAIRRAFETKLAAGIVTCEPTVGSWPPPASVPDGRSIGLDQ